MVRGKAFFWKACRQSSTARLGVLSFVLLVLDVLFGVSLLDVVAELDTQADALLDLAEASLAIARHSAAGSHLLKLKVTG